MTKGGRFRAVAFAAAAGVVALSGEAFAAQCGNGPGGFEAWKQAFSQEAKGRGVGAAGISALQGTHYNSPTIGADRGQHGFRLSLDQFMAKRGGGVIASRGRSLKQSNAGLFASIQQRTGVPAGPLIAIWGFETGFGAVKGNQHALSAVATLAYDCRRPEFFTDQLYAALTLIDRGLMSANERGSMHGEIGQTQFLPKNILQYGGGANLDTPSGALNATATFLKAHGWTPGAGYQPGEPNFSVLQAWNAASVYQQAIAMVGAKIDGGR